MNWTQTLFLFVYLVLFMGSIAVMILGHRRQRKMRLPFGDELKLLRAPGETQLGHVRKFDEEGFMWMMWAATAPAAVAVLLLLGTTKLPKELQIVGLTLTLAGFVAAFIFSSR